MPESCGLLLSLAQDVSANISGVSTSIEVGQGSDNTRFDCDSNCFRVGLESSIYLSLRFFECGRNGCGFGLGEPKHYPALGCFLARLTWDIRRPCLKGFPTRSFRPSNSPIMVIRYSLKVRRGDVVPLPRSSRLVVRLASPLDVSIPPVLRPRVTRTGFADWSSTTVSVSCTHIASPSTSATENASSKSPFCSAFACNMCSAYPRV